MTLLPIQGISPAWGRDLELHRKQKTHDNKMHGSFRETLMAFIKEHGIKYIVAEDVAMNRHFYDMRRLAELRGVLLEVCDETDIPEPEFINPATLKKWATETDGLPRKR
ncbi:MAG: hypothetical protein ACLTZY_14100 [Alistipes indistinctus]